MDYKVIAPNGHIVRHAGYDIAVTELLKFLWDKHVIGDRNYRQKFSNTYSNSQTIRFIDKQNGYIHEFTNVPLKMSHLDIDRIRNWKGITLE